MANEAGGPKKRAVNASFRSTPIPRWRRDRAADYRGKALGEFLGDLLRPSVIREYRKMMQETND